MKTIREFQKQDAKERTKDLFIASSIFTAASLTLIYSQKYLEVETAKFNFSIFIWALLIIGTFAFIIGTIKYYKLMSSKKTKILQHKFKKLKTTILLLNLREKISEALKYYEHGENEEIKNIYDEIKGQMKPDDFDHKIFEFYLERHNNEVLLSAKKVEKKKIIYDEQKTILKIKESLN